MTAASHVLLSTLHFDDLLHALRIQRLLQVSCGNAVGAPAATEDTKYQCTRGVYKEDPVVDGLAPSVQNCCQPTCSDRDVTSADATSFSCRNGAFNPAAAHTPNPLDDICCLATCGDTDLTTSSPVPFSNCGSGQQYDPSSARRTQPDATQCCYTPYNGGGGGGGDPLPPLSVAFTGLAATLDVGTASNLTVTTTANGLVANVVLTAILPQGLSADTAHLPAGEV